MGGGDDEQILSARWVFPATSPPLAKGTVTIRGDRIVSVDPAGKRRPDHDFGNAAIIPGLVNAHTHLDLSGLRGRTPASTDFVGWLRRVVGQRRERSAEQTATDVRAGLDECLRHGTTLVGDIASGGASWEALHSSPLWAVCFRELLGLPGARVHAVWEELVRWWREHPDTATCRIGVSPHAPYSVHKALIEAAARLWPVCIHLAESRAEQELLESRDGPLVPFLRELGVWDPSGLAPSWDWVMWKVSRAPAALLAHGNYLSPAAPVARNTTVVYCPRTHAAFDQPPHPFREMIALWGSRGAGDGLACFEPRSGRLGGSSVPARAISGFLRRTALAHGDHQRCDCARLWQRDRKSGTGQIGGPGRNSPSKRRR